MSKFVIQIGAQDGKTDSHRGVDEVWELITKYGWRGVLFEPNPRHFNELKRNYAQYGKQVILLPYAITKKNDYTEFFDCELDGASSLYENVLSRNNYHNNKSKNYERISIFGININYTLKQYGVPDYLVIDAEGSDGDIIEAIKLRQYKIPKIRFEFSHFDRDIKSLAQLGRVCLKLIKLDYKLTHSYADIIAEK